MKSVIINDIDYGKEWNERALHPLQSWQWGEARERMGIDVMRVGEYENKELKNVFQLTFHKIPYTNLTIGYLPRSVLPSGETLELFASEGRKRRVIFIKIEPNIKAGNKLNFQGLGLVQSSHPLFPKWTIYLDIARSERDLLKGMKAKTRYNIRLSQKRGVVVKEMTNNRGFNIFIKLYFETCQRQKYRGHNEAYHGVVFNKLKKDISHILIAFYKDAPLSAYHIFTFNDVLYYPYGGSSNKHRNLMASNLLMWEAIQFGQKSGCRLFDMWGSLGREHSPNTKWAGFTRFKEGYGGEFVEFVGSYDLVLNRGLYPIYNIADKLRKFII